MSERIPLRKIKTRAIDRHIELVTNWQPVARALSGKAFSDLCALTATPAHFMVQLPATLACQVFNHRLRIHKFSTAELEIVMSGEAAQAIEFHPLHKGAI